ncbi:hypothetical protein PAXINDRAFT_78627 [Paxillus involutus ATCC 200175]|uniref:Argonaute linker 1 domain-containing protein n=1 Tax=Paxillus involutus ATCC 200175 TaxID=664439 RepID=A0A0C9U5L4_PAXIN|nr:hypothetical protein PAXINDRAFT_78627 [Paxillus involutus ATCC 200175]
MGQQSHDNNVLAALTVSIEANTFSSGLCLASYCQAVNVVIRTEPTVKNPFNVRSFFTDRETRDIGGGLVLWRGYFRRLDPRSDAYW